MVLRLTDRRNKSIRYVLGAATVGNCDPAHMQAGLLGEMKADTRVAYGTDSYAEAAEKFHREGAYARAMWCARMAAALEDPREGDRLTDAILADPDVIDAIEHVRRDAGEWAKRMCLPEDEDSAGPHERSRTCRSSRTCRASRGGTATTTIEGDAEVLAYVRLSSLTESGSKT